MGEENSSEELKEEDFFSPVNGTPKEIFKTFLYFLSLNSLIYLFGIYTYNVQQYSYSYHLLSFSGIVTSIFLLISISWVMVLIIYKPAKEGIIIFIILEIIFLGFIFPWHIDIANINESGIYLTIYLVLATPLYLVGCWLTTFLRGVYRIKNLKLKGIIILSPVILIILSYFAVLIYSLLT